MPRGEMLRTKIKREILASQSVAEAVELAKQKIQQKTELKKPWQLSVREHLGKAIDRIDPLKAAAMVGTTILIKATIDSSEELLGKLNEVFIKTGGVTATGGPILHPSREYAELVLEKKIEEVKIPFINLELTASELMEWLISFAIAYYIVEHGIEIKDNLLGIIGIFFSKF